MTLPPAGSAQCTERSACENSNHGGLRDSIKYEQQLEKSLWNFHTATPVIVLRKWADNMDYIKKDLAPYSIAERILIPQLYGLSKYPLYRHALEETVPKCGVTGNQWNILVRTKLLNPHPWLATLQANCLETKFVAYSCSYYPTVTTQSVYNEPNHIATQMST